MEDRSYSWLLNLLSSKVNSLNLLDTYTICDQKPSFFYTKIKGKTLSKTQQSSNLRDLLLEIYKNYTWKQKIKDSGSLICYFIHQKERRRIFESDLREILSVPWISNLTYIQMARPNAEMYEVIYNLRMIYTSKGYVTKFSRVIDNIDVAATNCYQVYDQICDSALTLMILIEEMETKRVMILDVDFIEDMEKNIWVCFTREIKIAVPELCLEVKIEEPADLNDIPVMNYAEEKLSKLVNGEVWTKKQTKVSKKMKETKYVVQRGHIRNKDSILSSPIKILRPSELKLIASNSEKELLTGNAKEFSDKFNSASPVYRDTLNFESVFEGKKKEILYKEIKKWPEMRSMLRKAGYTNILQDINRCSLKYALGKSNTPRDINDDKNEIKQKKKRHRPKTSRLKIHLPFNGSKTTRNPEIRSPATELQDSWRKTFHMKSALNIKSKINKKKFKFISNPGSANFTPRNISAIEVELKSCSYLANNVYTSPIQFKVNDNSN
ncbi:unnamed protein product [Blepharisma stoltei]|uniref:Uncharacterized protein n=1 Tax=Blepharisma stoltei TaxID=1481888 RepID=A0AAU9JIQ2_9CILI|nr:unnamed protein product [Blepharisma stoltei]